MRTFRLGAATVVAALTLAAGVSGSAYAVPAVDSNDVSAVRAAYQRLTQLEKVPHGWIGDVASCRAGTASPEHEQATLEAVNIVRGMAGLDPVTFSPELNKKAHEAALVMLANNTLTHYPDPSMKCYTEAAKEAAAKSNIAIGLNGARAILGYMEDPGKHNEVVGHRRWILRPEASVMGAGSTSRTNALYVMAASNNKTKPQWVTWPTAGYFPWEMVPGNNSRRWSLSANGAWQYDFNAARVTVTGPGGKNIPVTKLEAKQGYANDTLVWEMDKPPAVTGNQVDTYTVKVTNIRRGSESLQHSYQVKLVQGSYVDPGTGTPDVNGVLRLTSHSAGTYHPAGPTIFSGTGKPGARIEVSVDGQSHTTYVEQDGRWRIPPMNLPARGVNLFLTSSLDGKSVKQRYSIYFGAKPASLIPPTVDSHKAGACYAAASQVNFSGRATPGSKITMKVGGITKVAWVEADGRWTAQGFKVTPSLEKAKVAVTMVSSAPGHKHVTKVENFIFSRSC